MECYEGHDTHCKFNNSTQYCYKPKLFHCGR